jgi:hypothetical protein
MAAFSKQKPSLARPMREHERVVSKPIKSALKPWTPLALK